MKLIIVAGTLAIALSSARAGQPVATSATEIPGADQVYCEDAVEMPSSPELSVAPTPRVTARDATVPRPRGRALALLLLSALGSSRH